MSDLRLSSRGGEDNLGSRVVSIGEFIWWGVSLCRVSMVFQGTQALRRNCRDGQVLGVCNVYAWFGLLRESVLEMQFRVVPWSLCRDGRGFRKGAGQASACWLLVLSCIFTVCHARPELVGIKAAATPLPPRLEELVVGYSGSRIDEGPISCPENEEVGRNYGAA